MQTDENELIGIIYETTLNPGLWPLILDGLAVTINDSNEFFTESLQLKKLTDSQQLTQSDIHEGSSVQKTINQAILIDHPTDDFDLFNKLKPHFRRALQLRLQQQEIEQKHDTLTRLMDNIPLGVLVVDVTCRLLFANTMAKNIIDENEGLDLKGEHLHLLNQSTDQVFQKNVIDVCSFSINHPISMRLNYSHKEELSLLISGFNYLDESAVKISPAAMVFLTPPSHRRGLSYRLLNSMFGLTKSETILANGLIQGKNVGDVAEERSVSVNTVRNQLSSLLIKTGTHRQSELICRLLSDLAIFTVCDTASHDQQIREKTEPQYPPYKENQIRLVDGRMMGYAEYGDPHGKPLFMCHSIFGCRYEKPANEQLLYDYNVRLIIPDRPGVGLSDPAVFSGYLDWAADLEQLAEYLKLDSFLIAGYGTGGNFALAAAWKLPLRINKVLVISPAPPICTFEDLKQTIPAHKLMIGLAQKLPTVATQIYNIIYKGAIKNTDRFLLDILPADEYKHQVLNRSYIRDVFKLCLPEIVKHGTEGLPQELRYYVKPWEFDLSEIEQPACFWHGELDRHAPEYLVDKMMSSVPNTKINRVARKGHTLFYTEWEDVLKNTVGM